MRLLHAAAMVDEPQPETENAGRDEFRSRGVGSSGLVGPGAIVAGLLFVYFGLPAFWIKLLVGIPRADLVIVFITVPIRWLIIHAEPYENYIRWQSELVGLK